MLEKLNKRRRHLLVKLLMNTKLNRDFLLYLGNRILALKHNRHKSLTIVHPTNVMLELGNVCNLHCSMCPREHEYGKAMDVGFMPLEKAKQIIDQMYPYLDSCGLTGPFRRGEVYQVKEKKHYYNNFYKCPYPRLPRSYKTGTALY